MSTAAMFGGPFSDTLVRQSGQNSEAATDLFLCWGSVTTATANSRLLVVVIAGFSLADHWLG
jgi:hypothetical protein